jgi:hypothetical protein
VTGYRAEQLTAEPRYEPSRGSAAIGQATSAVRGITSHFTVPLLADGAGGYLFALIFSRDLPDSECRGVSLALPAYSLVCPKAIFFAEWFPLNR